MYRSNSKRGVYFFIFHSSFIIYIRDFQETVIMKNVVIRNLYAVGMHHWAGNQLQIGPVYYSQPEPNNVYDANAVAIFEEKELSKKAAYLRREDAKLVKQSKGQMCTRKVQQDTKDQCKMSVLDFEGRTPRLRNSRMFVRMVI